MGGIQDSRASTFLELEDAVMKAKQFKRSRNLILRGGFFDTGEYSERDLEASRSLSEYSPVSKNPPLKIKFRDLLNCFAFITASSSSRKVDALESWIPPICITIAISVTIG